MKTYWGARIYRRDSFLIRLIDRLFPRFIWTVRVGLSFREYVVLDWSNPYFNGKAK